MHPKEKIVGSLAELSRRCWDHRKRLTGDLVALTSGCFDLLHGGHLEYLLEAESHGFLVVGINSDSFVKRLKGLSRPVRGQNDRAFTIAGFSPVWLTVIFDDDLDLIRAVRPDVYIASTTSHIRVWDDEPRLSLLREVGSVVVELSARKEESTTDIIRRVVAA